MSGERLYSIEDGAAVPVQAVADHPSETSVSAGDRTPPPIVTPLTLTVTDRSHTRLTGGGTWPWAGAAYGPHPVAAGGLAGAGAI